MEKKKKKIIIVIMLVFVIGVVLANFWEIGPFAISTQQEGIVCNYLPLSIDRVSVSTKPNLPGDEIYVLYLTDRSGSRCIRGSYQVDKEDIENAIKRDTGQDVEVEYNLWIGIENVRNDAEYKRGRFQIKIPEYNLYDLGYTLAWQCEEKAKEACRNVGGSYVAHSLSITQHCNAVCQRTYGEIYELNAPDISYKADITVRGRNTITRTIGSTTADVDTEQQFGNDAYVIWAGGLLSGYEPPSESARRLMLSPIGDRIVRADVVPLLDSTIKWHDRCIRSCMSGIACTYSEFKYCNNQANKMNEEYIKRMPWNNAYVSGTSVKMDLSDRPPAYGTFYMEVDADWLGIYVAMAEPDIKDCTNFEFYYTGEDDYINYKVYNKGSDGNVRVRISCDTGVTPQTLQNDHYIRSGDTISGNFKVSQSENEDKLYRCTLTASSTGVIGVSPNVDTCSVTGIGHSKKECYRSNRWICIGGYKAYCTNNFKITNKQYCENGCEETLTGAECILVGCTRDSDCPENAPFCVSKKCVECKEDKHCPDEKPICKDNTCVESIPCREECEKIETGILHPFGSIAKQICLFKCWFIEIWDAYKWIFISLVIGLIVIMGALVYKKYKK